MPPGKKQRTATRRGAKRGSSAPRRRGKVTLRGQHAGELEETDDGIKFTYVLQWLEDARAVPISVTLPLRPEPYEWLALHPFFENLLPEGWLLDITSRRLRIPKEDVFGMLLAAGKDCVGAVEITPQAD